MEGESGDAEGEAGQGSSQKVRLQPQPERIAGGCCHEVTPVERGDLRIVPLNEGEVGTISAGVYRVPSLVWPDRIPADLVQSSQERVASDDQPRAVFLVETWELVRYADDY